MAENRRSIFHGMKVLIGREWQLRQAVVVEDGKIKAIIDENMVEHHLPATQYKYDADHALIPGLIDLHIHGAAGHDVMDGSVDALNHIAAALAKEGVTGFLATTMTADRARLEMVLANVAVAMSQKNSAILGVHLEGPFLAKEKSGAQNCQYLQDPDSEIVRGWQQIAKGAIKILTLAPELPGALPFIRQLRELDIVAAIGHTNATYAETERAIATGANYATHLFNGMRMISQREPGATGALLLARDVYAELIVDHFHLHPAIIDLAFRVKGKNHLLLVSDAMRAKCLRDGDYDLGGLTVTVRGGKATLADGRLAGSTLRLPDAIKNLCVLKVCAPEDAIAMATLNPAHITGCADRKGSIDVGKDADLVILNAEWDPVLTMRGGERFIPV